MTPIPINLVVEDELSRVVLQKLLGSSPREYVQGAVYGESGVGYIKARLRAFNQAAKGMPYLVLVDLDQTECAPVLIREWLGVTKLHHNLLFRVAVRSVEAWLLAHREAFARFAQIPVGDVPYHVETVPDPKKCLIGLVSRSRSRKLREDIVPPPNSLRKQGPNYNAALARYIKEYWEPDKAMGQSDSLRRLIDALAVFCPRLTRGATEDLGTR